MKKQLFTIGHSNRTPQEFIRILHAHDIQYVVDVRSIPKSRHVPWANQHQLMGLLHKEKIKYMHLAKLGGLRHSSKASINTGWRNESFRGFADYMQTSEFYEGLKELNALIAKGKRVVILCAEAVPWRCHRSLIADAEVVRHYRVLDIMSETILHPHQLTTFAVVDRTRRPMRVYYPADF